MDTINVRICKLRILFFILSLLVGKSRMCEPIEGDFQTTILYGHVKCCVSTFGRCLHGKKKSMRDENGLRKDLDHKPYNTCRECCSLYRIQSFSSREQHKFIVIVVVFGFTTI